MHNLHKLSHRRYLSHITNQLHRQGRSYDPQKGYWAVGRLIPRPGHRITPYASLATRWQHRAQCGRWTMSVNSLRIPRCTIKQECGVWRHSETGFHGRLTGLVLLLTHYTSDPAETQVWNFKEMQFLQCAASVIRELLNNPGHPCLRPKSLKRENWCRAYHVTQDTGTYQPDWTILEKKEKTSYHRRPQLLRRLGITHPTLPPSQF